MDNRFTIDEDEPKSQLGLWIVAGGLILLLAGYHLFGKQKAKPAMTAEMAVASASSNAKSSSELIAYRPTQWPAIVFDDLVENNPFDPSQLLNDNISGTNAKNVDVVAVAKTLEESREEKRKRLDAIAVELAKSEWKVKLVLKGGRGNTAVIGNEVVYEGDELNGYKIVAIQDDGVIVEPLKN